MGWQRTSPELRSSSIGVQYSTLVFSLYFACPPAAFRQVFRTSHLTTYLVHYTTRIPTWYLVLSTWYLYNFNSFEMAAARSKAQK